MTSYLDNAATTPLCEPAKAAMLHIAENVFGNPSSLHSMGLEAEKAVSLAREQVAQAFRAQKLADSVKPEQFVFTSGGTEANNLAVIGTATSKPRFRGKTVIVGESEHASVSECAAHLESLGYKVIRIASPGGVWDMEAYKRALSPDVILVSSMLVNNETGALYNSREIARLAHEASPDVIFHADAIQAFGKFPLDRPLGADLISVSSHKIGGPKGVGALWISDRVTKTKSIAPVLFGGGQEKGLRSGTENVIGIAGFGAAASFYASRLKENEAHFAGLRAYLTERLASLPENAVTLNEPAVFVNHIVSLTVSGIRSETMLHSLSAGGVYVSSGSACSSNTKHKSNALFSFGLPDEKADCTIRVSFGIQTEKDDIDALIFGLSEGLSHLARKR